MQNSARLPTDEKLGFEAAVAALGKKKYVQSFLEIYVLKYFSESALCCLNHNPVLSISGLKANVSEAEHPLLCEGTRRQRGDLAIAMLVHYKDDQKKLSMVSGTKLVSVLDFGWEYGTG